MIGGSEFLEISKYDIAFNFIDPTIAELPIFEVILFTKYNITSPLSALRSGLSKTEIKNEKTSYQEIIHKIYFMADLYENLPENAYEKNELENNLNAIFPRSAYKNEKKINLMIFS